MANPIVEEELLEAETLLTHVLVFNQEKKHMNRRARNDMEAALNLKIEHFLRRDEPESGYYERFGDHDIAIDTKES